MSGNIVNVISIVVGCSIGMFFKGKIKKSINDSIINALGLSTILIGIMSALEANDILLLILSLCIGTLLGELIDIELRLERFASKVTAKFSTGKEDNLVTGFVTATLLFCVGSMAILGALNSGLFGNHDILYTKSVLDGVISIVFSASMGLGVAFSAVSVFIYQGGIILLSGLLRPLLDNPELIGNINGVGGVLIVAIGINIMNLKKMKVGNMLPSIFIPMIWFFVLKLIS